MNTEYASGISVTEPVGKAIERVKSLLFRPFDISVWFVIGFCAFLAHLGSGGGGGNFNFNFPSGSRSNCGPQFDNIMRQLSPVIIALIAAGVIIGIIVGIVAVWLSSRGRFMLLHCVGEHKAEVKVPWSKFRIQGNSLFLFRIVVGIIGLISMILLIAIIALPIILLSKSDAMPVMIIFGVFSGLCLLLPVAICFGLIGKFTNDFVVPIMYLHGLPCTEAWRQFLTILKVNKANFTIYILFQFVISIVISGIVFAVVLCTCGCACCFMCIPYIGTVLLSPIFVFKRAYSAYYIAQFGAAYNVFRDPAPVVNVPPAGPSGPCGDVTPPELLQ